MVKLANSCIVQDKERKKGKKERCNYVHMYFRVYVENDRRQSSDLLVSSFVEPIVFGWDYLKRMEKRREKGFRGGGLEIGKSGGYLSLSWHVSCFSNSVNSRRSRRALWHKNAVMLDDRLFEGFCPTRYKCIVYQSGRPWPRENKKAFILFMVRAHRRRCLIYDRRSAFCWRRKLLPRRLRMYFNVPVVCE